MLDREGEGQPHADGDRLAMQQPVRIAGEGLERMAEGVAEIEQRAGAGLLALVGRDDRRLGAHAGFDRARGASSPIAGENLAANVCSSQAKNGASPSSPYFTTSA